MKPGTQDAGPDEQVEAARREVETSRLRLAETRANVVRPLEAAASRNNFAVLIASTLAGNGKAGHGKGGR